MVFKRELYKIAKEASSHGFEISLGDRPYIDYEAKKLFIRKQFCLEAIHECLHELGHLLTKNIKLNLPVETLPPCSFKLLDEYLAWYLGYYLCIKLDISAHNYWKTALKNWNTYHYMWSVNRKYKK